jgi:hypothetical protein
MSMLYWQMDTSVNEEVLQYQRIEIFAQSSDTTRDATGTII